MRRHKKIILFEFNTRGNERTSYSERTEVRSFSLGFCSFKLHVFLLSNENKKLVGVIYLSSLQFFSYHQGYVAVKVTVNFKVTVFHVFHNIDVHSANLTIYI